MIVLGTNVLSEPLRPSPDTHVVRWLTQVEEPVAGRPLSVEDGMIAAICRVHGARLATRDVKDFAHLGPDAQDPWEA